MKTNTVKLRLPVMTLQRRNYKNKHIEIAIN